MAVNGFDFNIDSTGEIIIDPKTFDIANVTDIDLKIQLAYTRIKSCVNEWYYDRVGANLEELVGRAAKPSTIEAGKSRIIDVLTFDDLWNKKDLFIQSIIEDATKLTYAVYFRIDTNDEFGETSKTIYIDLDLIKGVKIRYGWGKNKIIHT
jgi:hypothetical protein